MNDRFDTTSQHGRSVTLGFLCVLLCLGSSFGCRHAPKAPLRSLASGHFEEFESSPPPRLSRIERQRLRNRWDLWADQNLQTGDLVFRRESWRVLGGVWDVTKFISKLGDTNYSHAGIVAIEDGEAHVYDTTRIVGVKRVRFSEFLFASEMNFAVKRLRPEYQYAVPDVMAYVKNAYECRVPFDVNFDYGEDTLYCTEMLALAHSHAGVELTGRTAYEDFPRWGSYPTQQYVAATATGWTPQHEVYAPGNENYGLWGSDKLQLLLVARNPQDPHVLQHVPYDADPIPRGFKRMEDPTTSEDADQRFTRF